MSTAYRILAGSLAFVGWTGLGCFLWALITPGQEQLLEMKRKAMKENPAGMEEIQKQNELILKVLKEAAETTENVTRKSPWASR